MAKRLPAAVAAHRPEEAQACIAELRRHIKVSALEGSQEITAHDGWVTAPDEPASPFTSTKRPWRNADRDGILFIPGN